MGYIPAPAAGVLKVQAVEPPPKDRTAWIDTARGGLRWFSDALARWVPSFESAGDARDVQLVTEPLDSAGYQAVVIGDVTGDAPSGCVIIGPNISAEPTAAQAVVIGDSAWITGGQGYASVAVGAYTKVSNTDTAIGYDASADGSYSVAIGPDAATGPNAGGSAGQSVAIGAYAYADAYGALALGASAAADEYGATVVGFQAAGQAPRTTAVGHQAEAADQYATALGYQARAEGEAGLALGYGATADAARSIAIGRWVYNADADTAKIGATELEVLDTNTYGPTSLILTSPDGSRWRITVDNSGAVTAAAA